MSPVRWVVIAAATAAPRLTVRCARCGYVTVVAPRQLFRWAECPACAARPQP